VEGVVCVVFTVYTVCCVGVMCSVYSVCMVFYVLLVYTMFFMCLWYKVYSVYSCYAVCDAVMFKRTDHYRYCVLNIQDEYRSRNESLAVTFIIQYIGREACDVFD